MRLTVVGCSGSFPGPDSPASCYLVEHDGYRVVLDLGNGALGALQRYVALDDVDAVVLSHLHADHCSTSARLRRPALPAGTACSPPLPRVGPSGTAERLARVYGTAVAARSTRSFDFVDARRRSPRSARSG